MKQGIPKKKSIRAGKEIPTKRRKKGFSCDFFLLHLIGFFGGEGWGGGGGGGWRWGCKEGKGKGGGHKPVQPLD